MVMMSFVLMAQQLDWTSMSVLKSASKGQIKPKADWHIIDSPKKQTNEFVLFAFLLFTVNKTNLFVTAPLSCFWFYLTFIYTVNPNPVRLTGNSL